ncbi:hypothetical protein E8D34_07940 [Nocardioides sp. GY 10113]|uniref:carboxymuconolactone decarboxylase family protein n=1 Tax=Nocardioides sp. GY 10113 TaxID=2569761 RepID=UPI0010A91076|nr:carboxymuconolactone decarboxylase family protein [Nocardioides sp. GY 10113]TIC87612.1 hypothetical protein E8D34_07940 [Nocardioides sp. GY 10113]
MSASFLADPEPTAAVRELYAAEEAGQGYVAHLTRLWAHSPEALHLLGQLLGLAGHRGGLDGRERTLLVTAAAAASGNSYCSLAFGSRLAAASTEREAAAVIAGGTPTTSATDAALVAWARRVAVDPRATTEADLAALREVGCDDGQVFAITLYVALRLAFATVNDALGAAPDAELAERVPPAVLAAVDFGRPPATRPGAVVRAGDR